jgi:MinD-like ATPase involved in chromosome partitioning or flagellar assembly
LGFRTAVAICLPTDEYLAVGRELAAAGYDPVRIMGVEDLENLLAARPEVSLVILDGESDFDTTIEMYEVLHEAQRDVPALMVVAPESVEQLSQAGRSRVNSEFLTRPFSPSSLRWRVEAMLIRSQTLMIRSIGDETRTAMIGEARRIDVVDKRPMGQIIVVFNPKGGVGKTTISMNTSSVLQMRKEQRVMLIDCDTVTGHVSTSLGMGALPTVVDVWTREIGTVRESSLSQIASRHSSGIDVLVMSNSPLHTEVLEPRRVAEAIAAARVLYDWVIVDMHPDYGPLNQAIFALADQILVPVTPDVPTIRAAVQFREVSVELQVRDRLALIVNRSNSGVSAGDIEKVVHVGALARIRSAGELFVKAANTGRTAVEAFPQARVIGDFEKLSMRLMEVRDSGADGVESLGGQSPIRGLFSRFGSQTPMPRQVLRAR